MGKEKIHISVVSPVYGCSTSLLELYIRLKKTLEEITKDFEIIFINDASPDNAWDVIKEMCKKDTRVKGINLSRNFGQHHAIIAGLEKTRGEYIVVLDCDLQDRPEDIVKLYNQINGGFDVVHGRRIERQDNIFKRFSNYLFYLIFKYLTDIKIDRTVANFRIINRKVLTNLIRFKEQKPFFGGIINWMGFNVSYVDIDHDARKFGKTSYNILKLLRFSLDLILSFTNKPLKLCIKFGFLLSALSSSYIVYKIISNFISSTPLLGWSSLIASIFFTAGLLMAVLGIVGLYIGRIFDEVKNRPIYIVDEEVNI